jgi:hypothetical protein
MARIETTVDLEKDLTMYVVNGKVSADEIIEKVVEYYTKHPTKLVLWVMEDAFTEGISTEEIQEIILTAKKYSGSRKEGKTAIVGPKEIDYGLGRMYQTFSEIEGLPYEYRVFKELEEAKNWLGV